MHGSTVLPPTASSLHPKSRRRRNIFRPVARLSGSVNRVAAPLSPFARSIIQQHTVPAEYLTMG